MTAQAGGDSLERAVLATAEAVKGFAKQVEDTGLKMAEMQVENKSLRDKLDEYIRKFEAGRVSMNGGDRMLAVIPENRKHIIKHAEQACNQWKQDKSRSYAGVIRACLFPDDPAIKAVASEWLAIACMKILRPGDFVGRAEYFAKLTDALGGVEKAAMAEGASGTGGALVPTIVESEVLRLIADNSVLRPLVRKVTMTTNVHQYPTRNQAFTTAIIAEAGSITDSVGATPFAQSPLTAKKLAGFATVSNELMQDNVVMLGDYLGTEFGEQIGRLEDTQALEGDGTGVNFTGVVAASGVNAFSSGANGDFLSYSKLVDTIFGAQEMSALDGEYLFMHHKVVAVLFKSRSGAASPTDQGGVPLVAPAGGITVGPNRTVLGFPFLAHSGILTNRTVGTGTNRTNVYAGPPRTIIFGDLLGFSIELNPYAKFQNFQTDIRGVKRTGILVAVPAAWSKYTAIDPTGTIGV